MCCALSFIRAATLLPDMSGALIALQFLLVSEFLHQVMIPSDKARFSRKKSSIWAKAGVLVHHLEFASSVFFQILHVMIDRDDI